MGKSASRPKLRSGLVRSPLGYAKHAAIRINTTSPAATFQHGSERVSARPEAGSVSCTERSFGIDESGVARTLPARNFDSGLWCAGDRFPMVVFVAAGGKNHRFVQDISRNSTISIILGRHTGFP